MIKVGATTGHPKVNEISCQGLNVGATSGRPPVMNHLYYCGPAMLAPTKTNVLRCDLMPNKKDFSLANSLMILTKISFGMITPILGGVLLGKYLDNRYSKNNLFLIILTILGGILAFQYLIIQSKNLSKKQ